MSQACIRGDEYTWAIPNVLLTLRRLLRCRNTATTCKYLLRVEGLDMYGNLETVGLGMAIVPCVVLNVIVEIGGQREIRLTRRLANLNNGTQKGADVTKEQCVKLQIHILRKADIRVVPFPIGYFADIPSSIVRPQSTGEYAGFSSNPTSAQGFQHPHMLPTHQHQASAHEQPYHLPHPKTSTLVAM